MEETVLLNFEIDQGAALADLKATDKAILETKESQKQLNEEYKKGTISQDQYVEENIRLQQQLKKEQDSRKNLVRVLDTESNSRNAIRKRVSELTREYNNLNLKTAEGRKRSDELEKELKQLNDQLNKGSKASGNFKDNIGRYTESIQEAVGHTNVAGVSVGDLSGKFASLANPITAAIGLLTALGAAYAKSSTGARDLEFAQARVSSTVGILIEDFGKLVGGPDGGGGQGIFSKLVALTGDYYKTILNISSFGLFNDYLEEVAKRSNEAALAQQRLTDLTISAAFSQGDAKESERQAEIRRRIRDDEEQSLKIRLQAAEEIDKILTSSGERTVTVLKAQIAGIKQATIDYENNRNAQLEVAQLTAEIADKEEEITGKLTENVTARRNIIKTIREQAEAEAADARARQRASTPGVSGLDTALLETDINTVVAIQQQAADAEIRVRERLLTDIEKINKDITKSEQERAEASERFAQRATRAQVLAARDVLAATTQLFEEGSTIQRFFALASIGADTAEAIASLTAASEQNPANGFTFGGAGIAQFASGIIRILTNIATAKSYLGFADGGWTGPGGKYTPKGIVHANEVVWNTDDVMAVGGPAAANAMRPTARHRNSLSGEYFDGGIVTNAISAPSNQQLATINAIKSMPVPVVSWVEGERTGKRVRFKESISRRR